MSKPKAKDKRRYSFDDETEKWLIAEARLTESTVSQVVRRLTLKEMDRRSSGSVRTDLATMYATSRNDGRVMGLDES